MGQAKDIMCVTLWGFFTLCSLIGLYITNNFMNWEKHSFKNWSSFVQVFESCHNMSGYPDRSGKVSESDNVQVLKFAKVHNKSETIQENFLATHLHFTCCVICCCEELHVAVVWWRLFNICWPNTHPNFHPGHEISVWKKYYILKWNICRNPEVHYSMSFDWLSEWLENLNTESDDVLRGSVESVCYCGFGVISSLCLLISLFELSSTHCPAPRVLASLAVG